MHVTSGRIWADQRPSSATNPRRSLRDPFLPMTTVSNGESKLVGVFRCRAVETAVHGERDFSGIVRDLSRHRV
jgi:hypothetical protein